MLEPSNEIVIIDDNEGDLNRLSKIFIEKGIGCRAMLYDSLYETPLSGVRFLFLDVNLAYSSNDTQRYEILREALEKYISEENTPFALILWTSNPSWKDGFIDYINRDENDVKNKICPYYIDCIGKQDFTDTALDNKLGDIFTSKTVQTLLSFEKSISSAAHDTLSRLIELIPKGDRWGDCSFFEENFKKIFTKIAIASAGCKHAKKNPDKAINEALCSIYADTLMNQENDHWRDYLGEINTREDWPENFSVSDLNTIFHIDTHTESIDEKHRGVVHEINDDEELFKNVFLEDKDKLIKAFYPNIREDKRGDIKFISLEFSAACDFSQDKRRTNRYMLGVIITKEIKNEIVRKNKNLPLYLYYTPIFNVDNAEIVLCLNLNFTFTIQKDKTDTFFKEKRFIIRKDLMDLIGSRYANHIARLGITEF